MNSFKRLLKLLAPHKKTVTVGLSSLIVVTLISLVPPLVFGHIFDDVILVKNLSTSTRVSRLFGAVALLIILYSASSYLSFKRRYIMHVLGEKFILDLRKMVYFHLQTLSLSYFETRQTGEIMSRVSNDTEVVEEFITHASDTLIADVLKLLTSIGILIWLSPTLTLITLVPVPVLAVMTFFVSRKMRRTFRATRERLAQINAKLQDNLSGIRVIKSFTNERHEYDQFTKESNDYYDKRVEAISLFSSFGLYTEFTVSMGHVAVLGAGAYLVISGHITPGVLVSFFSYLMSFYEPVRNIARVNETIQRSLAAADRIFEILDTQPEIRDELASSEMPLIKGCVKFENVYFRYSSGEEVLTDININAQPGHVVALVGRSGAGKTSIVNLIPRFYDPIKGRVLIDGIDIRTVKQESLRKQIALVLQDTFLFNGTIRDNIAYGKLDATNEEIENAAKAANAHEFIQVMPDGYDTEIGERGIRLSGGQRQRLAIARAVLANPKILILDEATSSVDSESEYLIHRAMDKLMEGRTTFVIAHRLSTVKGADIIITLDSGRVVEMGSHESLLSKDGAYSQMYEMYERTMDE
jgi:subfamily B ATP-binding cassette protein MsbA